MYNELMLVVIQPENIYAFRLYHPGNKPEDADNVLSCKVKDLANNRHYKKFYSYGPNEVLILDDTEDEHALRMINFGALVRASIKNENLNIKL